MKISPNTKNECYDHYALANPDQRLRGGAMVGSEAQLWEYHSLKAEHGTRVERRSFLPGRRHLHAELEYTASHIWHRIPRRCA